MTALRRDLNSKRTLRLPSQLPVITLERDRDATKGLHRLRIPARAELVALMIEVIDPEPYDEYRLRILDFSTGEEILVTTQLTWHGKYLGTAVPASIFEPRRYRLELQAVTEDGVKVIDDDKYRRLTLQVDRPLGW